MSADRVPLTRTLEMYFLDAPPPGVVSAYLFGSHAEGRAHRESDVDIGVVVDRQALPTGRERFDLRVRLASALIAALHKNDVDVVVLNDAPPLFARRVIYDGVEVYCQDRDLEIDFRRDVQLRAADLEPFLRKYHQIKLDALAR